MLTSDSATQPAEANGDLAGFEHGDLLDGGGVVGRLRSGSWSGDLGGLIGARPTLPSAPAVVVRT